MTFLRCNCKGLEHSSHTSAQSVDTSKRGWLTGLGALSGLASVGALGLGGGITSLLAPTESAIAQTPAKPHRIDIHHHVVPPKYAEALKAFDGSTAPKWSPQMSIEDMDMNGIATSVVALMQPGPFLITKTWIAAWPERPMNTPPR